MVACRTADADRSRLCLRLMARWTAASGGGHAIIGPDLSGWTSGPFACFAQCLAGTMRSGRDRNVPVLTPAWQGRGSEVAVEEGRQLTLRKGTHLGCNDSAVAKQHQRGNAANVVFLRDFLILVDVDLGHAELVTVIA